MNSRSRELLGRAGRRASWQPPAQHEQLARDAAAKIVAPPRTPARSAATGVLSETLDLGNGQPLGPERALMEARLQRDFSDVRVHTGPEAAEFAEAMGANALAYGRDVVFGEGQFAPENPAGQGLLAHELTHTAQQADATQPAVQMQPKKEKGGIGSKPPADSFIKMNESGAEDGFSLFEKDSATLSGDGVDALLKVIGKPEGAINVHIHGYASDEGPGEYNLNLSAHRAAAAKTLLEGHLPEGSKVTLFAHGETKEFGTTEKNRRVGVSLITPLTGLGFQPKFDLGLKLSLDPSRPSLTEPKFDPTAGLKKPPGVDLGYSLDPATGLPPGMKPAAPPPAVLPPAKVPLHLIDFPAIHGPLALRGTSTLALGADIYGDWSRFYLMWKDMGLSEKLAAKAANWTLSGAYDAHVSRNQPSILDRSNADFAAAYPGEHHTPIIPIINPDTLEFAGKYGGKALKATGKAAGTARTAVGGAFQAVGDLISEHVLGVEKKEKKKP
jgi:outer membrane protein OmpA-like peptidoglycan-associated protein